MTPQDFEGFVGGVAMGMTLSPVHQYDVIVAMHDPGGGEAPIAMVPMSAAEFEAGRAHEYLLARDAAALLTRVSWSPDESDTVLSWLMVAVTPDLPAVFACKRDEVDDQWWRIDPPDAPWFALSTAGGLRRTLTDGTPLTVKTATDQALFHRPTDEPRPPVDEQGLL